MRPLTIAIATLAMLFSVSASTESAPEIAPVTEVAVHVNLCVAAGCTELAEAVEPADGVEVTLISMDSGVPVGTCVTGDANPGTCTISLETLPDAVAVAVREDTIPQGYMADTGTAPYQLVPETPEVRILLYPEDGQLAPAPGQDDPPPTPPDDIPTEVPGSDPVPLPEPIAGSFPASIYDGTCADLDAATSAEPLADLTIVEGDHVGSPDAIVAASGYSLVPVSMGDIVNGAYAIAVMDENQTIIACGDIGGPLSQAGALSIGLAPVDGSGATGVAYVVANGESEVGISVFLVPGGVMEVSGAEPGVQIEPEATPVD